MFLGFCPKCNSSVYQDDEIVRSGVDVYHYCCLSDSDHEKIEEGVNLDDN